MSLKSEPTTITWDNLFYKVTTVVTDKETEKLNAAKGGAPAPKKKKGEVKSKIILNKVSGQVRPGQSLAIMGPSGSGKTSLINVLSRRIRVDAEGKDFNVRINDVQINDEISRRYGAFVPQEDIMPGTMSPREALMFNAHLRLPESVSLEEKKQRVDVLLKELGLSKVADQLIGFTGQDAINSGLKKSLSGGERKRLSIALELITNPSLIFLDEPTTGLDSFSSLSVVNSLQRISEAGKTVIYTIHQPSDEIFEQFDQLLVLGLGEIIYYGPARDALPYFAKAGYHPKKFENPADFLLKIVHVDPRTKDHDEDEMNPDQEAKSLVDKEKVFEVAAGQVRVLADMYMASPEFAAKERERKEAFVARGELDASGHQVSTYYRAPFGRQCQLLIGRQLKNLVREPMQLAGSVFQAVFFSVVMGTIFLRMGRTQRDVRNRLGCIFFATIFQMFGALLGPLYLFPAERNVFMREQKNGLYSIGAYYLSRVTAEIPKTLLSPTIFTLIFYFLVNLNDTPEAFFIFLGICYLQAATGFALGVLVVAMIPDPAVAMSVIPLLFLPIFLLSGFYLRTDNIPKYFIPFEYGLAFTKYSFHALVNNEFSGTTFTCTPDEIENSGFCPFERGEQVLVAEDLDYGYIWLDALILAIFIVCFHVIAFWKLRKDALKGK